MCVGFCLGLCPNLVYNSNFAVGNIAFAFGFRFKMIIFAFVIAKVYHFIPIDNSICSKQVFGASDFTVL